MDSNPKLKPPQSELSKIAREYNSLLWQLKGNIGSVKYLKNRIPTQGILIAAPFQTHPQTAKGKLAGALANAINQLEYCEYLIRCLSESHREAYKYTRQLGIFKERENKDD